MSGNPADSASMKSSKISFAPVSDGSASCAELVESSPCSQACPIGTNVKAYVSLIATGRFDDALDVAREPNPFPGICGRVCTHPCEEKCNRSDRDDPVAIAWLKRFAADYELRRGIPTPERVKPWRKEKVAVIGAGPAGLTAARDLVLKGYSVTVFEAQDTPGGMLVGGIPTFRLPRRIVSLEIGAIKDLGVEIKTGIRFGKDVTFESLKSDGYKAVLLAIGAWKSLKIGAPGEDMEGVYDCIGFLGKVNEGAHPGLKGKVAVIGGGSSAVDSARAAVRLGADSVAIYYRRTEKEMPASPLEIHGALQEGVSFEYLTAPIKITPGKPLKLTLQQMELGEPDDSGRRRPVPIKGSEYTVEVDTIVKAIGQAVVVPADFGVEVNRQGRIVINEETMQASLPGVYAGGDGVYGPSSVIDALRDGRKAAHSIDVSLGGTGLPTPDLDANEFVGRPTNIEEIRLQERMVCRELNPEERVKGFSEVELGFDEDEALREANRCWKCDWNE